MPDIEARILFLVTWLGLVVAAWQIGKLRERIERLEARDTLRACPEEPDREV